MPLAELQLSQPGASITLASDVSGDLSSVENTGGLAHPIVITATMPGGVLASECTFTIELRDVPLNDADDSDAVSSFTQTGTNQWTLVLEAGCWGPLVIALDVSRNGVSDSTTRRYNFRTPVRALAMPGNAEAIDSRASRSSYGGSVQRRSWFNPGPTQTPRGYADEWRALVRAVDEHTNPTLSALSFYARRGSGSQGIITSQQAYQEILGRGKEFTLAQFGWVSGDIGPAFQAACDAATAAGSGCVRLPAGILLCMQEIVVSPVTTGAQANQAGVAIRGAGKGQTTVIIPNDTNGIRFAGNVTANGALFYSPVLADLTLKGGGNPGRVGLTLHETIFATISSVIVTGWGGKAIDITYTNVNSGACQNTHFNDVMWANSTVGLHILSALHASFVDCRSNQNLSKGTHIEQCNGVSFTGLHIQDQAMPFHIQPIANNSIQLTIAGHVYSECTVQSVFTFSSFNNAHGFAGSVAILGGITVQSGSTNGSAFIDADGYALTFVGQINGAGWTKHIKCTNGSGFVGIGLHRYSSGLYDFDAASLLNAVWLGGGYSSVGAVPGANVNQASFTIPIKHAQWTTGTRPTVAGMGYNTTLGKMEFSLDGSTWRQLAES